MHHPGDHLWTCPICFFEKADNTEFISIFPRVLSRLYSFVMVHLASKFAITGVVFIGVLYQFFFKHVIFDVLGYGRKVGSIKDYSNARCEKIVELGLEGCEDMWLHQKTGFLYMACSDTESRQQWLPAFVPRIPTNTGND